MEGVVVSPVAMFLQAGIVGKSVIVVLGVASVWCWLLIVEGLWANLRLSSAMRAGWAHRLLAPIDAAGAEAARLHIPAEGIGETRQRIVEAMQRRGRELLTRAEGGLPNLAVISSVAPFVGLFGTVWGIMTSFASIAEAKDTSLAVVAPGIAEALMTTAFGLVAAIPASIGYNRIGAALSRSSQRLSNLIEERAVEIVAERAGEREAR